MSVRHKSPSFRTALFADPEPWVINYLLDTGTNPV